MSNKISVGTILYGVSEINNEIYSATVTKSGRKYFYVDNDDRCGYAHDTLKYTCENYSQYNIQLYRTVQEILDKRESENTLHFIRRFFDSGNYFMGINLSLDQLQRINNILNEPK